jgi:hypothetical protein
MKHRRSAAPSRKGVKDPRKKGQEESEKLLVGAGWTAAATQHFIDLPSDDERLNHTLAMFTITEDQYKYNIRSTYTVDFHFTNGLFCLEQGFDAIRMQFTCKSLSEMLDNVQNVVAQPQAVDFDKLRIDLLEAYQVSFFEFNAEEFKFTLKEAENILTYIGIVVIAPIRLIAQAFRREPFRMLQPEYRKVYYPVQPTPMAEMVEEYELPPPEAEFIPLYLPRPTVHLADVRDALMQWTDGIINALDRRYDHMDDLVQSLTALS